MTMAPFDEGDANLDMEFACSYSIGGVSDVPVQCGRRATLLVTWPPSVTERRTMTYCRSHHRLVEDMLNLADEVTDLVPDEC